MVQIISPCSQWLARCHVAIQRCSVAPAHKLSATSKLLSSLRLRLRRSFFSDWQRIGELMRLDDPNFRPRWAQRGADHHAVLAKRIKYCATFAVAWGPAVRPNLLAFFWLWGTVDCCRLDDGHFIFTVLLFTRGRQHECGNNNTCNNNTKFIYAIKPLQRRWRNR